MPVNQPAAGQEIAAKLTVTKGPEGAGRRHSDRIAGKAAQAVLKARLKEAAGPAPDTPKSEIQQAENQGRQTERSRLRVLRQAPVLATSILDRHSCKPL